MTYSVTWDALDGSGDIGYLATFDTLDEANAYAGRYAASVGETADAAPELLTGERVRVIFARADDGYLERIVVSDNDRVCTCESYGLEPHYSVCRTLRAADDGPCIVCGAYNGSHDDGCAVS